MKSFIFPFIISGMIIFSGVCSSCSDSNDFNYFLIPVDDIAVPDVLKANVPSEIKLSGNIGPDGCSSFERFITETQDMVVIVEAWGKEKVNAGICPEAEVKLSEETFMYWFQNPGHYTLKIKLPGDRFLERQVDVQ